MNNRHCVCLFLALTLIFTFSLATVAVPPLEILVDANRNDRIDDDEILQAVAWWTLGIPIPRTTVPMDEGNLIRVLEWWVNDEPFRSH